MVIVERFGTWYVRCSYPSSKPLLMFLYGSDDPKLPPIGTRLSLVKLFLEVSLFSPALLVLQGVMAVDDQEVEAWYLEGWCFFLMAEQSKETGEKVEELSWQELAQDARDCLDTCLTVSISILVRRFGLMI